MPAAIIGATQYASMSMFLLFGGKDAPLDYGLPLTLRLSHPLVKWAELSSTPKAWKEMMKLSNGQLKKNLFE
ncbi:hypothetical protein TUN199_11329, partial [Pyrenophora tritici-repentis]